MPKRMVKIRLRPDQEERINAIVERSAILDTSKVVRITVDWLLRSDIGEVIKTIVDDEGAFPDYAMPKTTGKSGSEKIRADEFRPVLALLSLFLIVSGSSLGPRLFISCENHVSQHPQTEGMYDDNRHVRMGRHCAYRLPKLLP